MKKLSETVFVCIDCEATGLEVERDRIIEIAGIRFNLERELGRFSFLVDPQMNIPEEVTKIHNITDDMVQGKPKIKEVLPEVLDFIGKDIIVGHGIGFDIQLVEQEASRADIPCFIGKNKVIDTLRMARLYGECSVNSLEMLRKHFNIPEEGAHRALNDVIVNVKVFQKLLYSYKTIDQLFRTLAKPVRLKTMPLGKHKGRDLREIPIDYLKWASGKDFDQDLLFSIRSEINRRNKGRGFSQQANPFSHL